MKNRLKLSIMLLGLSCMQSLSAQFTDVSKWYHQETCGIATGTTLRSEEIAAVKAFNSSNSLYQNYYVLGRQYAFTQTNPHSYSTFSILDRNSNPLASFTLDSYIKEGTGTNLPHIRYSYSDFVRTGAGTDAVGYYIDFILVGIRRDEESVGSDNLPGGVIVTKIKVYPYMASPGLTVLWKRVLYPSGFATSAEMRNAKITPIGSNNTYLINFWGSEYVGNINDYRDNYCAIKLTDSGSPVPNTPIFGFTTTAVKKYTGATNSDNEFLMNPIFTGTSLLVAGHSKPQTGNSIGKIFAISPSTGDIVAGSDFQYTSPNHHIEFTDMISLPNAGGYLVSGCVKTAGISYPLLMKLTTTFNIVWAKKYFVQNGGTNLSKIAWGSFISDYNNQYNLWLKTDDIKDVLTPEEKAIRLVLDLNGNVLSFGEASGSISRTHKPFTNLVTNPSQRFIAWGGHYDPSNTPLSAGTGASWFESKSHSNTVTPNILNICSEPLSLSISACSASFDNGNGLTQVPCVSITKSAGTYENTNLTFVTPQPVVNYCTTSIKTPEACDDGDANTIIATANESALNFNNVFVIAPNPTKDLLKLSGLAEMGTIHKVVILNMNGQVVQQQVIETKKTEMELTVSALPQGIYILKVDSENGQQVQKFVKE